MLRTGELECESGCGLVGAITAPKGVTHAQLALAWLLAQRLGIVPISGTTKNIHRVEEDLSAANVDLTLEDSGEIDEAAGAITVHGARYFERSQKPIDR